VETRDQQKEKRIVPTASSILDDGTIVEMVYRPDQRRTFFAIYNAGRWTLQDATDIGPDTRLVPFSPNNNLIKNEVVLLPSEPRLYGSEAASIWRLQVGSAASPPSISIIGNASIYSPRTRVWSTCRKSSKFMQRAGVPPHRAGSV